MGDSLIDAVHRYSGNYRDLQQLEALLEKNEDTLNGLADRMDDVLAMLSPQSHALAYVFLLHCKCMGSGRVLSIGNVQSFGTQLQGVVSAGDGMQLRMAGARLGALLRAYALKLIDRKEPMRGLALVMLALRRLQQNPAALTPAHPVLLQLCIAAKNYKAGQAYVENPCVFVDGSGATPRDYMLYCYYGGIVLCGHKRWTEAIKLFSLCMSIPAFALSAIAVEAFRKYVLASLISKGVVEALPKSTAALISRGVRLSSPAYTELATAYSTRDIDEVSKVVQVHQQAFLRDHNMGLVMQATASLSQQNTRRLTKTFMTLPLTDIAARFKLRDANDALALIARMIERGDVSASIDVKAGMVHFNEAPDKNDSATATRRLLARMQQVVMLRKQLDQLDENLSLSWSYLAKTMNDREGQAQAHAAPSGVAPSSS